MNWYFFQHANESIQIRPRFSNEQQDCASLLIAFGVNFVKGAGSVLMTDEHIPTQSTGLVQAEYVSFNWASA